MPGEALGQALPCQCMHPSSAIEYSDFLPHN